MSRPPRSLALLIVAVAGVAATAAAAWADPPARVGRLSTIDGTVSMHMAGEDQWSPAVFNYPVTTGSSFWTEPQSRADLRIGPTSIHLDGGTELEIVALDDHQLLANARQGRINFWVATVRPNDLYSFATPRGALEVTGPGTFRITAGNDQEPTEVAVLDGSARLVGATSTIELRRGEAAVATGPGDDPAYSVEPARPTPFDDASLAREHRERSLAARRYISPEMTGYEDLDENGSWRTEADIGPVWYPQRVPADWQPYRYGRWAWVDPWGWTWIDDQPWGFAPFHYGRWARVHERWGWVPGRITPRPAYAPALVAFIGGGGWSLGLSLGRDRPVGWFPLAPREVYVPPYRASIAYVRQVNITNVLNVTNITSTTIREGHAANTGYRNRDNAVVVRQSDFVGSRQVSHAALAVEPSALADAPIAHPAAIAPALATHPGGQSGLDDQGQRIRARAAGPPIRHAERTPPPQVQVREPPAGAPGPHIRQGTGATATIAPAPHDTPTPVQRATRPPALAAPGPPLHRDDRPIANIAPLERRAPAGEPQHQLTTPAAPATPSNHRDEHPMASAPIQHRPPAATEAAIPREPRHAPPEHAATGTTKPHPAIAAEASHPAPPHAIAPPVPAPPHPATAPAEHTPAKAEPPRDERERRRDEPHP